MKSTRIRIDQSIIDALLSSQHVNDELRARADEIRQVIFDNDDLEFYRLAGREIGTLMQLGPSNITPLKAFADWVEIRSMAINS